jgi:hypothetical protein
MKLTLKQDLPIKYYLNLYNEPGVADQYSTLYDILSYLIRVIESKNKELTLNNLKFSSKTLKYVFGDNLKDETFKSNIVKNIKELIAIDYLNVSGETISITENGLTYFYTIE